MSAQPPQPVAVYFPRVVDTVLSDYLRATGAVLIEGPRACGKTATATTFARSQVRLDVDTAMRAAGLVAPEVLLDGERPRLIDEWQLVPDVWNHVRRAVDEHPEPGQFILTGSAVPADDESRQTGGLRFSRLRMRPMTLAESGHSTKAVSLTEIMAGKEPRSSDPGLGIGSLTERIAVGGWPGLLNRSPSEALIALRGYLDETCRVDLRRVDGVRRDPDNVARVIRSLARNVGTSASARSIAADVAGADQSVDYHTVVDYVKALSRVFVVEDLPAWSPALRSRSVLRSAHKRHFVDPSLAVAALDANPERLKLDMNTLGFLFESLVIRDLRVYAQLLNADVFYYRDSTDLEADAIIQFRDGRWAAFEVKIGHALIEEAAANLLELANRVDAAKHGPPAALTVVTGWGPAYRRPDGVNVIPIAALDA